MPLTIELCEDLTQVLAKFATSAACKEEEEEVEEDSSGFNFMTQTPRVDIGTCLTPHL